MASIIQYLKNRADEIEKIIHEETGETVEGELGEEVVEGEGDNDDDNI